MGLDEQLLKDEIKKGEAAIKSFKEGIEIHKIVNRAFEEELKKCTSTS